MAGFIFTFGRDSKVCFESIKKSFIDLKQIPLSYELIEPTWQLAKFGRCAERKDNNIHNTPNFYIVAVGNVFYKSQPLTEGLKAIGNDLEQGVSTIEISEIVEGQYFLIILDKSQKKAHMISDIGTINIYHYKGNGVECFSTSMLALAQAFPMTPNTEAIFRFLRTGKYFKKETCFEEINVLELASLYHINLINGRMKSHRYWQVPQKIDEHIGFDEACEAIRSSIENILKTLPPDKTIFDFTGGFDARFVIAMAFGLAQKIDSPINAHFFGPPVSREARIVKGNCDSIGLNYHNYLLVADWENQFSNYFHMAHRLGDGMENACQSAPVIWVLQQKKRQFDYSVTGLFGELFRQRRWITEFGRRGKKTKANLSRLLKYRDLVGDFDYSIFRSTVKKRFAEIPDQLLKIYKRANQQFRTSQTPNTLQLDNLYFNQNMWRWGGRGVTTTNQIIKCVSPLWFKSPLSISLALPPKFKKKSKLMRQIAYGAAPLLAKEKTITDSPMLPIEAKNWHRFIPALGFFTRIGIRKASQVFFHRTIWAELTIPAYNSARWYKSFLAEGEISDMLNPRKMVLGDLFEDATFKDFIERGRAGESDFWEQIGNLLTMEKTLQSVSLKGGVSI